MLKKSLAERPVNRPSNINYRMMVIENINPALFSEIHALCSNLLPPKQSWLPPPNDKFSLPVNSKGSDYFLGFFFFPLLLLLPEYFLFLRVV